MKNEIRKAYKEKRSSIDKAEVLEKSKKVCKHFLESELYKNSEVLMLYMPLGNETDTTDIINKAFADGKRVAFPVTDEESGEITPCYATVETVFEKGAFSVREPKVLDIAEVCDINVVIVPGIAFDKNGSRIGFGKGCYDRLLKNTDAVKVGFCYDLQICDNIPFEEFDIRMDYVITENGIEKTGGN